MSDPDFSFAYTHCMCWQGRIWPSEHHLLILKYRLATVLLLCEALLRDQLIRVAGKSSNLSSDPKQLEAG
jgi:hypothetical protein